VRRKVHTSRSIKTKEAFEEGKRILEEDDKEFFKLFEESSFEGSRAAARKMKAFAKRETKHNQIFLLWHSLRFLARSDLEILSWPNSPLLVMLQLVDPNAMPGYEHEPLQEGEMRLTPLHHLADLADPADYSTHENQLILAKQLIEHGANVNALSIPHGITPLHNACFGENVTNLDFVKLLLEEGADPNAQHHLGLTPLIFTYNIAPGAAKVLLNWPTMDVNITTRSGSSFLTRVRSTFYVFPDKVALPNNPNHMIRHEFPLQ
jgi:hypothetical protein